MPPKSSKSSIVWKYAVPEEKNRARCKLCGVHFETSNNTTNAWNHLSRHGINKDNASDPTNLAKIIQSSRSRIASVEENPGVDTADPDNDLDENPTPGQAEPAQGQQPAAGTKRRRTNPSSGMSQTTIESSFQRSTSFKAGGEKDAELRDALLFMEMRQNLPLSFSDGAGFRHFTSKCVPLWTPPSRRTVTRLMEEKYTLLSGVLRETLRNIPSVCLTADNWTEPHTTTSYLGLTVHYAEGAKMQSAVIGMIKLLERHTGQYLSEKLLECCTEWSLDPLRIEAVITDNAENIKLAVKTAFGDSKLLTCFDHTLNLIPKAALGLKSSKTEPTPNVIGVPPLIKKVKAVVTFSHTSCNFSNEIKKIQVNQYGKTEGTTLRLLQDVPTRWGSTFLMLERWFELQPVVVLAASKFPEVDMPSAAEQQTLQSIMGVLKPLHEATLEMGAEKTTTLSKCIPLYYLLLQAVDAVPVVAGSIAARFKAFVTGELLRRFGSQESDKRLAAATIVDPRFMKQYFQSPLAAANGVKYLEEEIKQELLLCLTDQDQEPARQETPAAQGDLAADGGNVRAGSSLWGSHAALVATSRESSSTDDIPSRARAEVRGYLGREIVGMDKDPLKLWEDLKHIFPGMYPVARRLLTVVATSVSMERGFSVAGNIADDRGSRISSTHLAQRLFLATISADLWQAARLKE